MESYKIISFWGFIIATLFFGTLIAPSYAQTNEEDKTQIETMTIFGEFTPTIKMTPRIETNPGANEYTVKPPALDFEMKTEAIHSVEFSDLLPADPLPKESPPSYLHNYLILGFGNYITPYGEFYANTSAMNNHAFGIHLKHRSSQGGIKDYADNSFSYNLGDIYYKYSGDNATFKADLFLKRDVVHYYGFHPTETFSLPKDSVKQRYFLAGTNLSLESNNIDSRDFSYLFDVNYYNFSDRYKNQENIFSLHADMGKGFSLFNTRLPQKAGATFDFAVFNNKNVFPATTEWRPLSEMDTLEFSNTDMQLGIAPYFICDWGEYRLKIGADLGILRAQKETEVYIHPVLEATVKIIQNRLYLFGRLGGKIERNSFLSLANENPFIAPGFYTANFINKRITAAGGFSAMLAPGFDMKIGGEYALMDNMPFYVTNRLDSTHSFHTIFDKVDQGDIFVETAYSFSNKFALNLALHYYIYKTDSLEHAYYRPDFKMIAQGMYRPIERLRIDASFYFYSKMWAADPSQNAGQFTNVQLPALYTLNLSAEFCVWRELYLFVQANNIFAQNYERYLNYPTQGFHFMGGMKFRF
ncbi:MAG: hypothetical protein LBH92_09400 [Bacteroidales bacterium]|jgi:hypothetical protein|nr:hypothetical protein [Bacteroidales bacterium]